MASRCSEHPRNDARATCTGCSRLLCALCVAVPLDSNDEQCVHCHAVVQKIVKPVAEVAAPAGMRAPLPTASIVGSGVGSGVAAADPDASAVTKVVRYLFARETLWTLIALTIFTTILRLIGGNTFGTSGLGIGLIATGLEISYYFRVLTSVAQGDSHFETPDFSSLGEDVFDPLIRYVATLVPMIIAVFWVGEITTGHWLPGLVIVALRPETIFDYSGPGLLFGAWLALWPLMTCIAAIGKSIINAYNPATWVKTLAALNVRYVVGAVMFYALAVAETYAFPQLARVLTIPYLGVFLIALAMNLAMALRACVLGMVCEPYCR